MQENYKDKPYALIYNAQCSCDAEAADNKAANENTNSDYYFFLLVPKSHLTNKYKYE